MKLKNYIPFDKWIPKTDLIIGKTYFCKARHFSKGVWNGQAFEYTRHKFGATFPDTEYHWDNGPPFGTVKPFEVLD